MSEKISIRFRNVIGAFADGAVLFPLLALLSMRTDFSGTTLLVSAGIAYVVAGAVFRIPMAVQPLKAIAIASVAIGASSVEIRISAGLLGVIALAFSFLPIDRWVEKVPRALVHGLQLGFGLILAIQGIRIGWIGHELVLACVMAAMMVGLSAKSRIPLLGLVATGGLVWALFHAKVGAGANVPNATSTDIRIWIIVSLVLPQFVLTASNSVIGTMDVSRRYFGERGKKVTAKRLLTLIGLGNVISAAVGGMPFCHGAGGVTAHVQGGSTHWGSNLVIGFVLLVLAVVHGVKSVFTFSYPTLLVSSLLIATGVFHLQLVRPSWYTEGRSIAWFIRAEIVIMAIAAVVTQNMIWVFASGVAVEILRRRLEVMLRAEVAT